MKSYLECLAMTAEEAVKIWGSLDEVHQGATAYYEIGEYLTFNDPTAEPYRQYLYWLEGLADYPEYLLKYRGVGRCQNELHIVSGLDERNKSACR